MIRDTIHQLVRHPDGTVGVMVERFGMYAIVRVVGDTVREAWRLDEVDYHVTEAPDGVVVLKV